MMSETWTDIAGYEGLYQISNCGRVYSFITNKVLKPNKMNNGYLSVELWKNEIRKRVLIHRLVAAAFVPNPLNLPEVNHKDECKHNNAASNLEWCDRIYNANYGTAQIRKKQNRKITDKVRIAGRINALSRSKPVLQFSKDGEFIARYESTMDAERAVGVSHSHVTDVCLGRNVTAKGYVWKYERSN